MAEITAANVKSALSARGITIPDFEIDGLICLLNPVIVCLEANYPDECTQNAILLYAAILMGAATGARYLTSHSAPSGASESFGYGTKPWYNLYNQLKALDPSGCTASLVEDPTSSSKPYFKVVTGSRCFGGRP